MHFFDGKNEASKIDKFIGEFPKEITGKKLVIVQIGDNAASEKYVSLKQRFCEKFGIPCVVKKFSPDNFENTHIELTQLANDEQVQSIIIQLPLPDEKHYSLLNLIPLEKDIDILSANARQIFYTGKPATYSPVIRAVEHFIYSKDIMYDSIKKVGIIGYGDLVGKPLEKYLNSKFNTVKVIHNYVSGDFLEFDLLVLSTDVPNLVQGQDIKENCHVIDFGSNVVEGKTVGNLDLNSKLEHLGVVSKSPGGMGPLVVRYLILNHLKIASFSA
jgi:methylenetetrahydrofolate dehydrogenase (NADP+)/methenyltetrahydrofolate cyclohydrolase